jgi:hypothetical protein
MQRSLAAGTLRPISRAHLGLFAAQSVRWSDSVQEFPIAHALLFV